MTLQGTRLEECSGLRHWTWAIVEWTGRTSSSPIDIRNLSAAGSSIFYAPHSLYEDPCVDDRVVMSPTLGLKLPEARNPTSHTRHGYEEHAGSVTVAKSVQRARAPSEKNLWDQVHGHRRRREGALQQLAGVVAEAFDDFGRSSSSSLR